MLTDWFVQTLRHYPEMAVFLTLAIGFVIGKLKIGNFELGTVTSVLLVGICVGQLNIVIPKAIEAYFFLLFLFTTGYSVGPQFVNGLRKDGLPQALFSLILCVSTVTLAYIASRIMGWDAGTGAGLLAGGNTSSAIIGIAGDAIQQLQIDDVSKQQQASNVAIAYAVTYIFGTAGIAWFLSVPAFKILGGRVKEQCRELEISMGSQQEDEQIQTAYDQLSFRAYKLEKVAHDNITVKAFEKALLEIGRPVFVLKIRDANNTIKDVQQDTLVHIGDTVAISGNRSLMIGIETFIGDEMPDQELLSFPVKTVKVLVTKNAETGIELQHLRTMEQYHGISIRSIKRGVIEIPITLRTVVQKGDVIELVGIKEQMEPVIKRIGYAEPTGSNTDIFALSIAIFVGCLIGAIVFPVAGIPLTLSTSGGTLLMGLLMGWLRSRYPKFGYIPQSSQWLMQKLGLNLFIAVVGITASKGFLTGLEQKGISLFLAGVVVSLVPMIVGLLLGRYVFKFHPVITLGACAGAHTETAALAALQDALDSKMPALGYTVPYAVANIVLATLTVVLVVLLK